jgi:hypothetical protein
MVSDERAVLGVGRSQGNLGPVGQGNPVERDLVSVHGVGPVLDGGPVIVRGGGTIHEDVVAGRACWAGKPGF